MSDVLVAMIACAIFPVPEVPLGYREKVILVLIIMRFMQEYIKTEDDIKWVNTKLKEMEASYSIDEERLAFRRTNST
jgi:hypothetical protein